MAYKRDPRYDALPEEIRFTISPKEFAWLPDDRKYDLEREMVAPEDDAEDPAW